MTSKDQKSDVSKKSPHWIPIKEFSFHFPHKSHHNSCVLLGLQVLRENWQWPCVPRSKSTVDKTCQNHWKNSRTIGMVPFLNRASFVRNSSLGNRLRFGSSNNFSFQIPTISRWCASWHIARRKWKLLRNNAQAWIYYSITRSFAIRDWISERTLSPFDGKEPQACSDEYLPERFSSSSKNPFRRMICFWIRALVDDRP